MSDIGQGSWKSNEIAEENREMARYRNALAQDWSRQLEISANEIDRLRAALVEERKRAMEAGYMAGFMASGEGHNGEYPFYTEQDCLDDKFWLERRAAAIISLMEKPE